LRIWNNLEFTDQIGNSLGTGDVIALFHYVQLTVPLSYKIAPDQNHEYYFGTGPYFSYAVSGKGRIKHVALSNGQESFNLFTDDTYKRADAGIAIEIASRLRKKYLAAFNVDIGLSNVGNGSGAKLKQLAAGLSVGYLFNRRP